MLSRRAFLVGGLAVSVEAMLWHPAWAKHKQAGGAKQGPHLLAREDWPPAIAPAQIGVTDRGICCFTDEFGRLALIDFRKADATKPAHVLGELGGFAKKVIEFRVIGSRAYVIATTDTASQEPQLALFTISLTNPTQPSVVSKMLLEKFSEATSVTAGGGLVCVGGTSNSGEQMVVIYAEPKGKGSSDLSFLAAFSAEMPVTKLDLQNRNLLILETKDTSQLQYVSLLDPRSPDLKKTLPLDGDFTSMARLGDVALVAGSFEIANKKQSGTNIAVKSISLAPIPHVVSQMPLDPLTSVCDTAAAKGHFLVLGDSDQETALVSMTFDKMGVLSRTREMDHPQLKARMGQSCRIAVKDKSAYIATGWAGVQVLGFGSNGWAPVYEYTIPRYAASSIAAWKNMLVLAGSDMKLYDISQADKPVLVSTTEQVGNTRNIVGAGSYVLCLYKDSLTLRKMEKLNDVVATLKIDGISVCFDPIKQRAYVLQGNGDKKSKVTKIQAYSNSLVAENTFDLPTGYTRAVANDGFLAVASLNDLGLYKIGDQCEEVGIRHFENYAIRDIALTKDYILVTAVDQRSKGFFLVLSKDQKDLRVLGSTDLPNDGRALAVSKTKAVIVGQSEGKDAASVIDFSTPSAPKAVASMNVVEEAAAVAIKDETAIVGGRGLELFSLS
jgi:hypothetical protein